jgi:hypothetical protein
MKLNWSMILLIALMMASAGATGYRLGRHERDVAQIFRTGSAKNTCWTENLDWHERDDGHCYLEDKPK